MILFALPTNVVDTVGMYPSTPQGSNFNLTKRKQYERVLNPMNWLRNRCLPLFIGLVTLLWLFPYFVDANTQVMLVGLSMFAFLPAVGVVSLAGKPGIIISIMALILTVLGAITIEHHEISNALIGWSGVFVLGYYAYSTILVGHAVFRKEAMQPDRIYGGISVYLLIGIVFGVIHHRINEQTPGAYQSNMNGALPGQVFMWHDFIYFSFSTLTTIGYGDLVPISPRARSTALFEGVIGVLYPAILIAKLVNWPTTISQIDSNKNN